MRVALASIDGARIDQHFGHARYWRIYDLGDASDFVETRKTQAKCGGHCEGGFESQLEILSDCGALFVSKIGEGAAVFMRSKGVRVFEAEGETEGILAELANRPDLLEPPS
jgi:predicted Fe-Mo cluster-binding NifX family protein